MDSITKAINLCLAVMQSSSSDYKVNLNRTAEMYRNTSLAFQRDQALYEPVKPSLVNVQDEMQLKEGCLLLNYPTTVLARKYHPRLLNRDEILFITRVNELGVQGVVLNPCHQSVSPYP